MQQSTPYIKCSKELWEDTISEADRNKYLQLLNFTFGIKQFQENQLAIVSCILAKADVFVIMRSGGGKSLTFQLPALVEEGVTV